VTGYQSVSYFIGAKYQAVGDAIVTEYQPIGYFIGAKYQPTGDDYRLWSKSSLR